jgi:hypothetical protein
VTCQEKTVSSRIEFDLGVRELQLQLGIQEVEMELGYPGIGIGIGIGGIREVEFEFESGEIAVVIAAERDRLFGGRC